MQQLLDRERVMEQFALFADLGDEQERERWRGLCQAAAARLEARLRPGGVQNYADRDALCTAAGAWAYCDYRILGRSGGGDVRVGDITLRENGTATDAAEIRDYFLAEVAHLLQPVCPALILTEGGDA